MTRKMTFKVEGKKKNFNAICKSVVEFSHQNDDMIEMIT
jgi:hypothetical protein